MKHFLFALSFVLAVSAQAQMVPPPKDLKALEPMVGTFSGTLKTTMGDMSVVMTSEWAEGGMFLKTTNTMKVGEFNITETMYTGWDPKIKKYKAYAFQSMVPTPRIETGEMTGNKTVFISEPWEMMGVQYISRATMTFHTADELEFSMDFKMGNEWTPQGSGRLKRVKKAPSAAAGSRGGGL